WSVLGSLGLDVALAQPRTSEHCDSAHGRLDLPAAPRSFWDSGSLSRCGNPCLRHPPGNDGRVARRHLAGLFPQARPRPPAFRPSVGRSHYSRVPCDRVGLASTSSGEPCPALVLASDCASSSSVASLWPTDEQGRYCNHVGNPADCHMEDPLLFRRVS